MASGQFPPPLVKLPPPPLLTPWGDLFSNRASVPYWTSWGAILLDVFLEVPLPNQLLYFFLERVEFFSGVADSPVVLAVLATVGIKWWGFSSRGWKCLGAGSVSTLKATCRILARGIANGVYVVNLGIFFSMLLAGCSENHSKAFPVKEVENTRHQIGSLTT